MSPVGLCSGFASLVGIICRLARVEVIGGHVRYLGLWIIDVTDIYIYIFRTLYILHSIWKGLSESLVRKS